MAPPEPVRDEPAKRGADDGAHQHQAGYPFGHPRRQAELPANEKHRPGNDAGIVAE